MIVIPMYPFELISIILGVIWIFITWKNTKK